MENYHLQVTRCERLEKLVSGYILGCMKRGGSLGLALEKQCPAPQPPSLEPVSQASSGASPWHSEGNAPHLPLELLTQLLSGQIARRPTCGKCQEGQGVFKANHEAI